MALKRSSKKGKKSDPPLSRKENKKGFRLYNYDIETMKRFSEEIQDDEIKLGFLDMIAVAVCAMVIITQIRISHIKQSTQYVDSLPSIRLYRTRILCGLPGRTMCAFVGLMDCFPFIQGDIHLSLLQYTEFGMSTAKPVARPNQENYPQYVWYRMSQVISYIQAVPTTNINLISLPSNCDTWGLDEVITYLDPNRIINWDLPKIQQSLTYHILTNKGGFQETKVSLDEPSSTYSKLETQILGGIIDRTGVVSSTLEDSGKLPNSPITKQMLEKHLTSREQLIYESALATGNKELLQKLNNKVRKAEAKVKTPPTTPPSETD
jgi:hypothetical protein